MSEVEPGGDGFPESVVVISHPPEFDRAPPWARELWRQHREDRHQTANQLLKLSGEIAGVKREQAATNVKLGEEPDSDGKGGKGLIGDVRKTSRDVSALMDLRNRGVGFLAAIGLTSTLLILGVIHWVQQVVHPGAK